MEHEYETDRLRRETDIGENKSGHHGTEKKVSGCTYMGECGKRHTNHYRNPVPGIPAKPEEKESTVKALVAEEIEHIGNGADNEVAFGNAREVYLRVVFVNPFFFRVKEEGQRTEHEQGQDDGGVYVPAAFGKAVPFYAVSQHEFNEENYREGEEQEGSDPLVQHPE